MMLGLWVTTMTVVPAAGGVSTSFFSAAARRAFSIGETTSPPSVMSVDFSATARPASIAVSKARLKRLV